MKVTVYGRETTYRVHESDEGPWVHESSGRRFTITVDDSVWCGGSIYELTPANLTGRQTFNFQHEGTNWRLVSFDPCQTCPKRDLLQDDYGRCLVEHDCLGEVSR